MPEIVEIEILRKETQQFLVGKEIENVLVNKETILNVSGGEFSRLVSGKRIENARRKGKILILDLSDNYSIAIHFLLTGFMKVVKKCDRKKVQVGFVLSNGECVFIGGIMRGGFVKLLWSSEIFNDPAFKKLGIDAMSPEFTVEKLSKIVASNPRKRIKQLLMDQSLIAGIGNAYSDEILFKAGVLPTRKCADITHKEVEKIWHSIYAVFQEAERYGGASELTFVHLDGKKGQYHKHFMVHKRAGKPCFVCSTTIESVKVGGRPAYFCPHCQK